MQKECKEYVEGFYLDEGYNKNVPPQENVTIFDLQHVRDIVKVRWIFHIRISDLHKDVIITLPYDSLLCTFILLNR